MTAPPPYEEYSEHFSPLQVEVTGSFEEGLRHFKSKVQRSKILTLFKEKQSYEKPSERRRRKKRERDERSRLNSIREKLIATGEWDRRQKKKDARRRKPDTDQYE
jgi:ribosomal protein S21